MVRMDAIDWSYKKSQIKRNVIFYCKKNISVLVEMNKWFLRNNRFPPAQLSKLFFGRREQYGLD